jgi:hypothetical protein
MPVEIAIDFVLPGVREIAQVLGLAMRDAVGLGVLIALPPFGLLAGGSEIHNISHYVSRRYLDTPTATFKAVVSDYADTLANHSLRQPLAVESAISSDYLGGITDGVQYTVS